MNAHLWASVVVGVVVLALALLVDHKFGQPTPPDADQPPPKDRAASFEAKRETAKKWMAENGILSLHAGHEGGRTGWRKVNPMVAAEEEPAPPAANVLRMRGQR